MMDVLAILVTGVWLVSVIRLGVLNEWHHWMPGAWAYIGGHIYQAEWLMVAGLLVMADDAYAHLRQCFQPGYEGPLFRLYKYLYPHLPRWLRL